MVMVLHPLHIILHFYNQNNLPHEPTGASKTSTTRELYGFALGLLVLFSVTYPLLYCITIQNSCPDKGQNICKKCLLFLYL